MSNTCSQCNGKCCRTDLGYNVTHLSAGSDYHSCDYCEDGTEMAHWTVLHGFDNPPIVDAVSTSCHCGGGLAWILKAEGESPERMIGCTCHTELIIRPNKKGYEILWSRSAKE